MPVEPSVLTVSGGEAAVGVVGVVMVDTTAGPGR